MREREWVRLRERWVHIRRWVCVYASAGCVYAAGAYTHRRVRIRGLVRIRERWVLVRSGCVYTPGCVYAGRCVYASAGCVYAAGAYTHQGAYTRMGAFTRVVGAYTQRVHIHTRVCIRGSVRIRERWVCIHRGCVYAPPRVYTGFCVYAPPTAYTQESTNRNVGGVGGGLQGFHNSHALRSLPHTCRL